MRLLKCWVLGAALSLGVVAVYAGPYEDLVEAYQRGDHSAAARLARTAAEQGDARAQYAIGWMYANGWGGVPKDDQQAVAWYRKAAKQGLADAQHNLGLMYASGTGMPRDDQQAVAWYRKAAKQGLASAQHNLGLMYAEGTGVPRDDQQAVAWFRKAAEQGDAKAQYKLELMYAAGRGVPNGDHQAIPKADTSLTAAPVVNAGNLEAVPTERSISEISLSAAAIPSVIGCLLGFCVAYMLFKRFIVTGLGAQRNGSRRTSIYFWSGSLAMLAFGQGLSGLIIDVPLVMLGIKHTLPKPGDIDRHIFTMIFFPCFFALVGWILSRIFKDGGGKSPSVDYPVDKFDVTKSDKVAPDSGGKTLLTEDEINGLYGAAMDEVEGAGRDGGLWAKCYAKSNGDSSKAKARYIEERFSVLKIEAVEKKGFEPIRNLINKRRGWGYDDEAIKYSLIHMGLSEAEADLALAMSRR